MKSRVAAPGFRIYEDVIDEKECDALIEALQNSDILKSRAGARHLLNISEIVSIANDSRLLEIAAKELSTAALPFRATLFAKTASANWLTVWHQDTALPLKHQFDCAEWGPWSKKFGVLYAHAPTSALSSIVALRIHLDTSDSENGPLRVLRNTHELGVLTDDEVSKIAIPQSGEECLVRKGGVLSMSPLLIHSSSKIKNAAPRRVLHIEYANSLKLADNIELSVN
jgi:ectoine hydroxylase-related dioxygenase (phytanoyl-CoA dioxygenase family)